MQSTLLPALLLACLATATAAQEPDAAYPRPADVETIDGIVAAFFDVVSGPAGSTPDRARDESLHYPGARIVMSGGGGQSRLQAMDVAGYHERYGGVRPSAFYEREIHRETLRFGSIATVWSTYAASATPDGTPMFRGISNLHLVHDGTRWWIAGWTDQRETPDHPLPARFLPPVDPGSATR